MVSSDFTAGRDLIPKLVDPQAAGVAATPGAGEKTAPNQWIINPVVDFLFIYGGAFWLLLVLHVALFGYHDASIANLQFKPFEGIGRILMILVVVTPILFSDAHTVATYMRIYSTPESREQFKFYGRNLIFMPAILLTCAIIFPRLQGLFIYIHMMWVFQHYTSQTYGISLIYCYKRQYIMNNTEKRIFKWMLSSIAGFVITRLSCIREQVPTDIWGVPIPFFNLPREIHYIACGVLEVLTFAFVFMVIRKYIKEKKLIPIPCLVNILGVAAVGFATGFTSIIAWLWGTPFLHGAQYILVSLSYSLKEKGMPNGLPTSAIARALMTRPALQWMSWAILGGCAIYIVLPQMLSEFGWDFFAMVSLVQACVNFHHFLTDAAIWRMRNPRTRELLVS